MQREKVSAQEAVSRVAREANLDREKTHRVCSKVNRAILKREKTSHSPSERWAFRFVTAKPPGGGSSEKVSTSYDSREKMSSSYSDMELRRNLAIEFSRDTELLEESFQRLRESSGIAQKDQAHFEKVSKVAAEEAQRIKMAAVETYPMQVAHALSRAAAETTLAERKVEIERGTVLELAARAKLSSNLRWGETMHAVSSLLEGDPDMEDEKNLLLSEAIDRSGYTADHLLRNVRDGQGHLKVSEMDAAAKEWSVRSQYLQAKIDAQGELAQAVYRWKEASAKRDELVEAGKILSEQREALIKVLRDEAAE